MAHFGIFVGEASIAFRTIDLNDSAWCGFFSFERPVVGQTTRREMAFTAVNPDLSDHALVSWAMKVLGEEQVMSFAPHQSLVAVRRDSGSDELNDALPKGVIPAKQTPVTAARRRRFLTLAGQWGEPAPLTERVGLLNNEPLSLGGVTLRRNADGETWKFSQREFSREIACEFAAYILRDLHTLKTDFRNYAPFLVVRGAEAWHEGRLKKDAKVIFRVKTWKEPDFVQLDGPEDEEYFARALDNAKPLEGEQLSALHVTEEGDLDVALHRNGAGEFELRVVVQEYDSEGDGSIDGLMFVGAPGASIEFPSWSALARFCSDLACASAVYREVIPGTPDPSFSRWFTGLRRAPTKPQLMVRKELETHYASQTPKAGKVSGVADISIPGTSLRVTSNGTTVTLSNVDEGAPKVRLLSDWAKLALLVLSEPVLQTAEPSLYFPFLRTVLTRWSGPVISEAAVTSTPEPTSMETSATELLAESQVPEASTDTEVASEIEAIDSITTEPDPVLPEVLEPDPSIRASLVERWGSNEVEVLRGNLHVHIDELLTQALAS